MLRTTVDIQAGKLVLGCLALCVITPAILEHWSGFSVRLKDHNFEKLGWLMLNDLTLNKPKLTSPKPASGEACSDYLASGLLLSLPWEATRRLAEDLLQFTEQEQTYDDAAAVLHSESRRFIRRLLP